MSWGKVKLKDVLKQYRIEHRVQDTTEYKQVSILNSGNVVVRGSKIGREIGRKRQFIIDVKKYPNTLIFTRQLLLQGSIGIANEEVDQCIVTENMPMFSINTDLINVDFLFLFLKSEIFKSQIRKIELSGSAQKSIHEKTFLELEFFLPKLETQNEIANVISTFNEDNSKISAELKQQIDYVKQLRQAFLREAIQGRFEFPKQPLQDGKIETGAALLEKIKAEKAQLIKEKKIKKEKELSPISEDEIPFEIPDHWVWCRLGEVYEIVRGSSPRPKGDPRYWSKNRTKFHWITIADFTPFGEKGKLTNTKGFLTELGAKQSRIVKNGDLLIACSGVGSVGRSIETSIDGFIYDGILAIRNISEVAIKTYIKYFLKFKEEQIYSFASGANWLNINIEILSNYLLPFPPLHEQQQIVTKLEELMSFCDGLEKSIKESQGYNEILLQEVLREALQGEVVEN
jgi:type I restriction enzyme S subunit